MISETTRRALARKLRVAADAIEAGDLAAFEVAMSSAFFDVQRETHATVEECAMAGMDRLEAIEAAQNGKVKA